MADMEAGMGPFLGVQVQARGWSTGAIAAQKYGFPAAFEMLGGLSLGSLIIWLAFVSMLRGAGANNRFH